jgi:UrcA family protein
MQLSRRSAWPVTAAAYVGVVLVGLLALPALVQADTEAGVPTEVVRFQDLNLTSVQGVRVLYGRIRNAASDVCEPLETTGSRIPSAAWRRCLAQAIAGAVRSIDSPLLTAYHQRQLGHFMASGRELSDARE